VKDPEERLGEAYNIFDLTMKQLLNQAPNASSASSEAALSGKIMHIKSFVERDATTGKVFKGQIRCYFAYRNTQGGTQAFQKQEDWQNYINEILGDLVEGPVSFIQMQPQSMLNNHLG